MLRKNGYVIFSKEQNLLAGQYYFEYSFLKLNKRFFVRSWLYFIYVCSILFSTYRRVCSYFRIIY